ncbi:hypothetical protein RRSWK_04741 [Rhodopirellula sp. SWK7]|nr:hypothetical protein RRSWK_04741 [Rhodopirellula sp. SWK7]
MHRLKIPDTPTPSSSLSSLLAFHSDIPQPDFPRAEFNALGSPH